MSKQIELHPLYAQAALLIHTTGEKVTKEKMSKVFNHMNIDFDLKIAESFEMEGGKFDELFLNISA